MEAMHCVVLENDIIKLIEEINTQLTQGTVCCKCKNPCDKNTKCAMAMKNLLTDMELFKKAYIEQNLKEEKTEQVSEKQTLID